jgi:hypothetical protein
MSRCRYTALWPARPPGPPNRPVGSSSPPRPWALPRGAPPLCSGHALPGGGSPQWQRPAHRRAGMRWTAVRQGSADTGQSARAIGFHTMGSRMAAALRYSPRQLAGVPEPSGYTLWEAASLRHSVTLPGDCRSARAIGLHTMGSRIAAALRYSPRQLAGVPEPSGILAAWLRHSATVRVGSQSTT